LNSLDKDQQLIGSRALLHYILNNTLRSQDEDFFDQLLQLAMDFVSKMVTQQAMQVSKNQRESNNNGNIKGNFDWIAPTTGASTADMPSIDSFISESDLSDNAEEPSTIEEQLLGFARILEVLLTFK